MPDQMIWFVRGWMLAIFLAILSGCGARLKDTKRKTSATVAPISALFVGTISLVDEDRQFVLIESGLSPSPLPDFPLEARGPSGISELKAGTIRRRPLTVADIVKGKPHQGDEVFQLPR